MNHSESVTYSISELAKAYNVTPRAIRFYEDKGLLNPKREGSRRIYNNKDRVTLKLILRGKRLGFSLDECLELISMYDPATDNRKQLQHFLAAIDRRQAQLIHQLEDIKAMQEELTTAKARCLAALAKQQDTASPPPKHQNN
ncbi:MerR family DNA-binding transcriptional regulator [Zooshikella marina]|uniref:MerR family transcriptional regulator n=1 Tax=Zooshikella ganghwensis TaxID=202772 RepID=UPI001BB0BEA9|nr:MerR family DNA-binding transcriptional regulator [Zooshikella ganghwensis]MBU2705185.1 MerR family DNA-binding transcriptional regulator [Zooshikella ganghwensis]